MTLEIIHIYPNGRARTFTVAEIDYYNAGTSGIINTAEDGAVLISALDTPDIWAQLQASPLAYVPEEE